MVVSKASQLHTEASNTKTHKTKRKRAAIVAVGRWTTGRLVENKWEMVHFSRCVGLNGRFSNQ